MIPGLWRPGPLPAALRLGLLPAAGVFRVTARLRAGWHRYRRAPALPCPAIIVGNLTVGGTGKTPVAAWFVQQLRAVGALPGAIVHPAARDEAPVLAEAGAIVASHRRRAVAAREAVARGADVLVFDDGLQHPGLAGAFRVALVAAEQEALSPWPLPAGPWREPKGALRAVDLIVVTRKTAPAAAAAALARNLEARYGRPAAVAALKIDRFTRLMTGTPVPGAIVKGCRVLAVAGVADPEPFRGQLEALGATVHLRAWPDHHRYAAGDLEVLLEESGASDYVVCTSKDAAKLRDRWPAAPEPLVAKLAVHWEAGPYWNPRQVAAGIP